MNAFSEIVVAMDFSQPSERALGVAIDLARLSGGRIHLVHSYMELPQQLLERNLWIGDEVWDRVKREDAERLEKYCQQVKSAGIDVQVHQTKVQPSEGIAAEAHQIGADLIVMGTRGLSGLKHILLGSVAERTLRAARCPVLTVPGPVS